MIPSIDNNPQLPSDPSLLGNLSLNQTIHAGGITQMERAAKGEWNNDIYDVTNVIIRN